MKNKSISSYYVITFIFCLGFSLQLIAQEHGIYELERTSTLQKSSAKATKKVNNRSEFYNLYQDLQTTLFVSNNTIDKVYGEGDIKRITLSDGNSFAFLNTDNNRFKEVKLISIKLKSKSDLNRTLDLSNRPHFTKLKYVFLKCYFDYTSEDIQNFIKVNPNVRVFHKQANPS